HSAESIKRQLTNLHRQERFFAHAGKDQVVALAPDAAEIAYAVTIAVNKRARIDLIDNPTLPPSKLSEFFNSGFVIHVTLRILAITISGRFSNSKALLVWWL